MVNKNKEYRRDILFKKMLVTCNRPEEAARLFIKFCKEHPEIDDNEIHFEVIEEVREYFYDTEYDYYIIIFKNRLESTAEFTERVTSECKTIIDGCIKEISHNINIAVSNIIGFGEEANEKSNEIIEIIRQKLSAL